MHYQFNKKHYPLFELFHIERLEKMSIAIFQEQYSNGSNGSAGSIGFNKRALNTIAFNDIAGAVLSSNQVSLPPGKYKATISACSSLYAIGQAALWNFDADTVIGNGVSVAGPTGTGFASQTVVAQGVVVFELYGTTNVGINHYVDAVMGVSGAQCLGLACSSGQPEVFAQLEIQTL